MANVGGVFAVLIVGAFVGIFVSVFEMLFEIRTRANELEVRLCETRLQFAEQRFLSFRRFPLSRS